ncbi:hydroxyacid dehydrogenase, partial [Nonomuraea fuscirosea]
MSEAPRALLVMDQATLDVQFGQRQLRRLRELTELADPIWTPELDTPSARRRLRESEVLVTSWGCPPLTAERLAD